MTLFCIILLSTLVHLQHILSRKMAYHQNVCGIGNECYTCTVFNCVKLFLSIMCLYIVFEY